MDIFLNKLISDRKNQNLPQEFDYFGNLIGSWKIDYIDNGNNHTIQGEWHFAWILDGMAIQDIILLPNFEYGTTLRLYNPATSAWDIAYCYTGKIIRLTANKQDDKIVLTDINDERRKWVFVKIEEDNFHWQDVYVKDNGEWQIKYDIYAKRI